MEQPARTTLEYGSPTTAPYWTLTRVIAWMCVFPVLTAAFIYGTWVMAALMLGHAPGMYVDDPSGINSVTSLMQAVSVLLLVTGLPFGFAHVVIAVAGAIGSWVEGRWDWRRLAWCAVAVALWAALWWDPGRVTDWLMD